MNWLAIVRLGGVQAAIGAMVMLATSLLNRVMVVEYALAAALPAGLVAWHYAVQLSRPLWGHGSDRGARRTPWIIGGMAVLGLGTMLAVAAAVILATSWWPGIALAVLAFTLIGGGVGAAGTSLLALLASQVAPERRAAAAAITWIMMIAGIVITAGVAGSLIDPFSPQRLALVVAGVVSAAFAVATLSIWGLERASASNGARPSTDFGFAVREILADREARLFTLFVFVSMLAYAMQDMILEPFAGLLFAMSPGQSTQLTGVQHMGVLAGMVLVGLGANAFGARTAGGLRLWTVAGCIGSALALTGLAMAAQHAPAWPIAANVALLGFFNGMFAVSAIGAMMALAGAAGAGREGVRMGVWGAAQAIAFGLGGLIGAVGVDAGRALMQADRPAFALIFACEAALFLIAAAIATRAVAARSPTLRQPLGALA
ncbi:MAG: BCD family MFS transporter [Sphingomonadaceae bacterium]